jgi:lipoprotein-anchoring transpeptidase ErfK/SrfK
MPAEAEEPAEAEKPAEQGIGARAPVKSLLKDRGWKVRAGIGAAAAVVLLGIAAALLALLGRPAVSVSSGEALVQVQLSGVGTAVTDVSATSAGQPVALSHQTTGYIPVAALPQGRTVHVRVTAAPPSWLHWLLGSGVSTSATLRAPSAAPTARVAVAAHPGRVTLGFNRPVSVVDYKAAGGPERVIRLSRASTTAELTVPENQSGGALQVAAAAWPWERLAVRPATVDWLQAPKDGVPVAAAVPAPASGNQGLDSPITLTFDEPVAKALGSTRPRVSPHTAGTWTEPNADTLVFTPRGLGFGPGTAVSVSFDHRVAVVGGSATDSVALAASGSYHFAVTQVSVLRLQQILAQLHYLPLNFTPAAGVREPTTLAGEVATLGSPLKGSFSWRWHSTPAALKSKWQPGSPTVIVKGALMAFMSATDSSAYNGYTADAATVSQLANALWKPLLRAAAANKVDPQPYSYVHVTKNLPETLVLWENGKTVLTTPVNTGIASRPTADGTFPVYVRYTFNFMTGTNPDGTKYDDPVYWINYFNGGDAVHGFVRGSYGWPQSLGCVELPIPTAHVAFNHLAIGDLVTVAG